VYARDVEPASAVDDFLAHPNGRYFAGRHFFIWCHDPTFTGSVLWGRPEESDTEQIVRIWRALHPTLPSFDVVTDGSRIESVDAAAFDVMIRFLGEKGAEYSAQIRKQAIIHPQGLAGAAVAGILPAMKIYYRWQLFPEPAQGFAWLEREDSALVCAEVSALADRFAGSTELARVLEDALRSNPENVSLPIIAKKLQRSARSLQRDLQTAGTSFRNELDGARVALARALLVDSDVKIEAVARRVGCASAAHFATLFRRLTGETPGEYRGRVKR
jgi:transcriptional regulator GlxA family with amidase domain